MRIALFTNRDIYSCIVLNLLQTILSEHIVWIGYSDGIGTVPALPMLKTLRFYEQTLPYQILFPTLDSLPHTVTPNKTWLTFKRLLEQKKWQTSAIDSLMQPGLLSEVQTFAPDLCISVRFGKIFKGAWLNLAPQGILNLHSGLLPEYRGVLATFWTLLQGRNEYGCTLHWIEDDCIDTGRVITTIRLPVRPGKSLFSHIMALYEPGAQALAQAITRLANRQSLPCEIQQEKAQYFSYPKTEDCQRFLAQGNPIIDYEDYTNLLMRWSLP